MNTLFDEICATAARRPHHVFLSDRGEQLTYMQVIDRAHTAAARLRTVATGDRPCIIVGGPLSASIGVLACMSLGKPFIVVNPETPSGRLEYYARDSGADALMRAVAPGSDPNTDTLTHEIAVVTPAQGPWTTVDGAGAVGCLIYTSGSTGQPKAVVCPEAAMHFVADAIGDSLQYKADDVVLSALPLFFDFGLYQVFLAGLVGASVYFASPLESGLGLGPTLERTRASVLPMVPLAAEKLASLANRGLARHAVRMITTTGAALDAPTRMMLRDAWGDNVDVRAMYGLTECKRVAIMPPGESWRRPTASGVALAGTRITIRAAGSDSMMPAGVVGEICIEGPHVMAGYHNQPELSAARFRTTPYARFLRSGDQGYLDDEGFLYCLGREDSQFKVRGFRVSAAEIVHAAKELMGVESAAVVPPTERHDFALFYAGDEGEESVRSHLTSRLEPFAVPPLVRKIDALPTNANGKIDITYLKKEVRNG